MEMVRTKPRRFDGGEKLVGLIDAVGAVSERDPAWRVQERCRGWSQLVCRENNQMEKSRTQTDD